KRDSPPVELVSDPFRFAIRDPARLSWGLPVAGLACGLAAERDTVSQGEALAVHLGLRFDPSGAAPALGMLNDFSRDVGFTFTDVRSGKSLPRAPLEFPSPGPHMPSPDEIVPLRDRAVPLSVIDVALLTSEGEQLPEGTYSIVAWYENVG